MLADGWTKRRKEEERVRDIMEKCKENNTERK
jgi:hypothetical protein